MSTECTCHTEAGEKQRAVSRLARVISNDGTDVVPNPTPSEGPSREGSEDLGSEGMGNRHPVTAADLFHFGGRRVLDWKVIRVRVGSCPHGRHSRQSRHAGVIHQGVKIVVVEPNDVRHGHLRIDVTDNHVVVGANHAREIAAGKRVRRHGRTRRSEIREEADLGGVGVQGQWPEASRSRVPVFTVRSAQRALVAQTRIFFLSKHGFQREGQRGNSGHGGG